jgi:hypothetical protein
MVEKAESLVDALLSQNRDPSRIYAAVQDVQASWVALQRRRVKDQIWMAYRDFIMWGESTEPSEKELSAQERERAALAAYRAAERSIAEQYLG